MNFTLNDIRLPSAAPLENVVVSSRTRYARNLRKFSFARWAKAAELQDIVDIIDKAVIQSSLVDEFTKIVIDKIDKIGRTFLKESHLISAELEKGGKNRIVYLSKDSDISIMINEEDHLRIQSLAAGFQLTESFNKLDEIDEILGNALDYAYTENLGFLTACPTNVGTGLRASAMLHLPALVIAEEMNEILNSLSQHNLTVRGFYGEGSEFNGDFFQISNEFSLGKSELEIIETLRQVIEHIIEKEYEWRNKLFENNTSVIEDYIWRSFGVLSSARKIDSLEAIKLLSHIRLGIDKGYFPSLSHSDLNNLIIEIQPAHLQYSEGQEIAPNSRDIARASLLRKKFSSLIQNN